jgi:hypothetical protein
MLREFNTSFLRRDIGCWDAFTLIDRTRGKKYWSELLRCSVRASMCMCKIYRLRFSLDFVVFLGLHRMLCVFEFSSTSAHSLMGMTGSYWLCCLSWIIALRCSYLCNRLCRNRSQSYVTSWFHSSLFFQIWTEFNAKGNKVIISRYSRKWAQTVFYSISGKRRKWRKLEF